MKQLPEILEEHTSQITSFGIQKRINQTIFGFLKTGHQGYI